MIVSVEGSSRAEMAVEAGADDEAGSQQAVCRKWFALGKDSVDTGALGDRVSWSLSVDEGGGELSAVMGRCGRTFFTERHKWSGCQSKQ